jgi:endonuclease G
MAYRIKRRSRAAETLPALQASARLQALGHDASTLGGNSGSCVIELATGKVQGLHFGGVYRERNNAVPAAELGSDPRMHDAGVTFEAPRPGTAPPWSDWWNRSFAGESPDADPAPRGGRQVTSSASVTAATVPPSGKAATVVTASSGSVTMTIPLNITVSLGDAASIVAKTAATESTAADTTETLAMPWRDEDFTPRRLRSAFPRRRSRSAGRAPAGSRGRRGIGQDEGRRGAIALSELHRNARATAPRDLYGKQRPPIPSSNSRKAGNTHAQGAVGFGKNDQEQWFTDPRIDDKFQIPDYFTPAMTATFG